MKQSVVALSFLVPVLATCAGVASREPLCMPAVAAADTAAHVLPPEPTRYAVSDSIVVWLHAPTVVAAGDSVPMRVEIENTARRRIRVHLRGGANGNFVVTTPEGVEVWSRFHEMEPLATLDVRPLNAGERLVFSTIWDQTRNVEPRLRRTAPLVGPGPYLLSADVYFADRVVSTPTRPLVIQQARTAPPRGRSGAIPDTTLHMSVRDSVQTVRCTPADSLLPPDACELILVSSVQNPSGEVLHLDACRFRMERWEGGSWGRALLPICPAILRTKPVLPGETIADTVRLLHYAGPNIHSDFVLHGVAGIYRLVRPVYWRFDPPDQVNHRGEMRPAEPAVSRPFRVAVPSQ